MLSYHYLVASLGCNVAGKTVPGRQEEVVAGGWPSPGGSSLKVTAGGSDVLENASFTPWICLR